MILKQGIFYSELLSNGSVVHGFTTRSWGNLGFGKKPGDPEVIENRNRLFDSLELTGRHHIQPHQVHSNIAVAGEQFIPGIHADGVFSRNPSHLLSVLTADCLPILVYHSDRVVAAIHGGWRGLYDGIIPNTLANFPSGGVAAIGPAIAVCCYEVSVELAEEFAVQFGQEVVDRSRKKPHLDLFRIAEIQLRQNGVANIDSSHLCTACSPDTFFSYRREGSFGRMMSFIGL